MSWQSSRSHLPSQFDREPYSVTTGAFHPSEVLLRLRASAYGRPDPIYFAHLALKNYSLEFLKHCSSETMSAIDANLEWPRFCYSSKTLLIYNLISLLTCHSCSSCLGVNSSHTKQTLLTYSSSANFCVVC